MKKFAAAGDGSITTMQQRYWAFLVIFLVSGCFVVVNQVQAQTYSETVEEKQSLIELNEENWRLMLKGEWMVEFFAPWCPACKNLAPTWDHFATTAADINVNVAKIDVTTSPSLSGRFFVTALPTIYHVKDGEFRQYRGSRDGDALMFFVRQKQWSKLEPISAWKKPDTIHMSVLSYFFKLSHTLKHLQNSFKDFNGRLQEEYGLPTWGSYALFAIGTIFVGAALGLMLVCIVDFLYPPKKSLRQSFSDYKKNSENGLVEDIAQDEIEDDVTPNEGDEDDKDDEDDAAEEQEDEDEEDEDNDEEDNEDNASTDDEKQQTQSESEEPESEKKEPHPNHQQQKQQQKQETEKRESADSNIKPSPIEVRKRKPRKAD